MSVFTIEEFVMFSVSIVMITAGLLAKNAFFSIRAMFVLFGIAFLGLGITSTIIRIRQKKEIERKAP